MFIPKFVRCYKLFMYHTNISWALQLSEVGIASHSLKLSIPRLTNCWCHFRENKEHFCFGFLLLDKHFSLQNTQKMNNFILGIVD